MTPKQKAFVAEYLVDLNAAHAAERAGYSKRTAKEQGYQMLQRPEIVAQIQAAMQERSKRTEITADYVLKTIRDTVDAVAKPGDAFDPMAVFRGCELLGKHLKLWKEQVEHTGPGGGAIQFVISDREAEL